MSQPVSLSPEEKKELKRWAAGRRTPARQVLRAKIVLAAARGLSLRQISEEVGTGVKTVHLWKTRFAEQGMKGIEKDAPRPGRKPKISEKQILRVVGKTVSETPPDATHWTTRAMAKVMGISPASVGRIWRRFGLKPHRYRTFKVSNDPDFAAKVVDIVGLYLNPPTNAIVLSVDEKSQIQALDRTQPGLPFKPGRAGTMTHDYKRHGTTTLFAALDVLTGYVISSCKPRHTHKEWLSFLKQIDREIPRRWGIHIICDNYAAHKHPAVQEWLQAHRRFTVHFTPTSASWINQVERFFAEITRKRIRRGVFKSVRELEAAIDDYIERHNEEPVPFIWTATADEILDKVNRARAALRTCSPSV